MSYSLDLRDYSDKWSLMTADDGTRYWMLDVVYCSKPALPEVQHMIIYAPESYMAENDGLVSIYPEGSVKNNNNIVYTPASAPIIYTNTSGGYSSSKTQPVNIGYMKQGYVQVSIGARGKETKDGEGRFVGQFPLLMVDLKAGIRFLKANKGIVPGNTDKIVSHGYSSGGAVSVMLGASGNSPIYDRYFEEIGAAEATDDICVVLGYCPITNLSSADAGYEWFQRGNQRYCLFNAMGYDYLGNDITDIMPVGPKVKYPFGSNILGGAHEDKLAEYLYNWFVSYVRKMLGEDALTEDGRGGPFFTEFVQMYADSLTTFARRYSDVMGSYEKRFFGHKEFQTYKELYPTWDAYLQHLKKDHNSDAWLSWDGERAVIKPEDYDTFMNCFINRNKMCPSLDSYNKKSNEASAFQEADGTTKHFSAVVRDGLEFLVKLYEERPDEFTGKTDPKTGEVMPFGKEDLDYLKALADIYTAEVTDESVHMLDIMSPVSYIINDDPYWESKQAPYWRFQIGSGDGDQGIPQAWITLKALEKYVPESIKKAEMSIIWDRPHCPAEYDVQDLYDYLDKNLG